MRIMLLIECLCLIPVLGGVVFNLLCVWKTGGFKVRKNSNKINNEYTPAISILKPIYGLEKNQRENLRSTCLLDYPQYEVVFSLQRKDDPALPLLLEIQKEFGIEKVKVVIDEILAGPNGKINNMLGGYPHAKYDVLVISDSDVYLTPEYLKAIVAPLSDPTTGFACTPFKCAEARTWYEKMELLSLNADFMPSVIFAYETNASLYCLGASIALRRETLEKVGGLETLVDYLVEDYEMGRRIVEDLGLKAQLVLPVIDTMVDLQSPSQWWKHQVYWDQNTRAARPYAFFSTLLIRSVPFALIFAVLRMFDPFGLIVLGVTLLFRLISAGITMRFVLGDKEGPRALYLLPIRDIAGLVSWIFAFTWRTTTWRGTEFVLTREGRLVAK